MRGTYITALVIAVILALWLYSGDHEQELIDGSIADNNRENARVLEDAAPTRVRVAVLEATERAKTIQVRGKTENKRTVMAKAELVGTLVARPVERGTQVQAGDVLCDISPEDRFVSLNEARAELNQARIDYQGALKLKQKGFNSESAIAAARTRLAASEAKVRDLLENANDLIISVEDSDDSLTIVDQFFTFHTGTLGVHRLYQIEHRLQIGIVGDREGQRVTLLLVVVGPVGEG